MDSLGNQSLRVTGRLRACFIVLEINLKILGKRFLTNLRMWKKNCNFAPKLI